MMAIDSINEKLGEILKETKYRKPIALVAVASVITLLIILSRSDREPMTVQELSDQNRTESVFGLKDSSEEITESEVQGVLDQMKASFAEKEQALKEREALANQQLQEVLESYQNQQTQMFELKKQMDSLMKNRGRGNNRVAQVDERGQPLPNQQDMYANGQPVSEPYQSSNPNVVYKPQMQVVTPEPVEFDNDVIRTITQRRVTRVKENGVVEVTTNKSSTLSANSTKKVGDVNRSNDAPNNPRVNDQDNGEFTLSMGSIISGTILNGVAAPTGVNASSQPIPVLMRVKREAIMPNHFVLDIRECHMLGEAAGSLSDERVQIRAVGISCITNDGQAIEKDITAYAVSSTDGMAGIRGTVVSRSGDMIMNTMTAGFLSGFAQAAAPRQLNAINTTPEADALWQQQNINQFTGSGMLTGASDALNRLADYYMSMVEQTFPVVELTPGIQVDFIVQRGMTLNLDPSNNQAANQSSSISTAPTSASGE